MVTEHKKRATMVWVGLLASIAACEEHNDISRKGVPLKRTGHAARGINLIAVLDLFLRLTRGHLQTHISTTVHSGEPSASICMLKHYLVHSSSDCLLVETRTYALYADAVDQHCILRDKTEVSRRKIL